MDLSPYRYQPITEPRCIRLLTLHPGLRHVPLKLSLSTICLDDAKNYPMYEAISYVWGDASIKHPVTCDGGRVDITANLKDALEQFRDEDGPRMLWADALCINQNDLLERAAQVRLMWDIYAFASHCLVWVGKPTENTFEAIYLIRDLIHDICGDETESLPKNGDFVERINDRRGGGLYGNHRMMELPGWKAVVDFFDRPYFSRIWVVQELNACPAATVFCGSYQLLWSHVVLTAQCLGTEGAYENKKLGLQQRALSNGWWTAGNMTSVFKRYSRLVDLPRILQAFHACQATDPRDKIFALMGFDTVCAALADVSIDYTISAEKLFTQVAKIMLNQEDKLHLLSYHWHGQYVSPLSTSLSDFTFAAQASNVQSPSWVPKWRRPPDQPTLLLGILGTYDASGGLARDMEIIDDQILRVSGHAFDTIVKIYNFVWVDVSYSASPYMTLMAPKFFEIPFPMRQVDSFGTPDQGSLDSFMFAITAGLNEAQMRVTRNHRDYFNTWYNTLFKCRFNLFPGMPRLCLEGSGQLDWEDFQSAAYAASRGRCIFVTRDGRIGLGPLGAQNGDLLCVLHGGDVPYVMRTIDNEQIPLQHFVLVGEAYAPGAMDGEVVRNSQRWPEQNFYIR